MKLKKKKFKPGVWNLNILREYEISKSTHYRFIVREHVSLLKNLPKLKILLIIFYVLTVCILFWLKRNYWHATLDTALFAYYLTSKWPCPILGTLHRAIPTICAPVYMWRDPRKGTYDPKNRYRIIRDSISFPTDLSWGAIRNFLSTLFYEIWIIEKKSERVQSGSCFFNRSPCKLSLLDRRSLFSDRVTYINIEWWNIRISLNKSLYRPIV